jgi:chemotaxis signal transduction protein
MGEPLELLVCRLGPHRVAMPALQVVEVLPMLELVQLPLAPRHCLGLFDFRGTLTPTYDLGARLGAKLTDPEERRHLLVVQAGATPEAWVVDRVVDLATLPVQPPPVLETASESTALLLGLAELEQGRVAVLDVTQLLRPGARAQAQTWLTEVL